jgi:hypothetical protein
MMAIIEVAGRFANQRGLAGLCPNGADRPGLRCAESIDVIDTSTVELLMVKDQLAAAPLSRAVALSMHIGAVG